MLLIAGFGWAKPVPINPYALEKRASYANLLVSLAGVIANFITRDPRSHSFQAWIDPFVHVPGYFPSVTNGTAAAIHHHQPGFDAFQPHPAGAFGW